MRSSRTWAVAAVALVMPVGITLAAAPATVASPDQVVQVQEAAKKKNKQKSSPAKAAKEARKVAQKAAKEAKKAEKQAAAADRAVKKALKKAQKLKKTAKTPAAKRKVAEAWKAVKQAKKAKKKAEKLAVKTAKKAEKKKTLADKKTAVAATVKSVSIDALPAISQQGAAEAAADQARNVVVVRTSPAIAYIPLEVEAQTGGGWTTVAKAQTGEKGLAEIPVPQHSTYRVVAKEKTSTPDTVAYSLDYSDEFSGGALGAGWSHRMQSHHPAGFRACSKGDPRATTMTGQALRLWVLRDPERTDLCPALRKGVLEGPYAYRLNGHVSTEKSYTFKYGVAAARMKFQKENGQHAGFWLQPQSHLPGGRTPEFTGAEIDVIEWFGRKDNDSTGLAQFTYHNTESGQQVKTGGVLPDVDKFLASKSDDWFTHYHVFSVEWTPSEYIFRIDGQESWRSKAGISHRPQFLILSLLSSDYEIAAAGAAGEASLGTQFTEVDWVRVWN